MAPHDTGRAGDRALVDRLFSPAGRADPHTALRGSGQIGCRHASARQILHSANFLPAIVSPSDFELFKMFARWLISLDGERHRVMRRAFSGRFTPRTIDTYREPIHSTANALLDAVVERGRMDLVRDFARPLPLQIICRVLGIPAADVPWVDERMVTLGRGFAHQRDLDFLTAASDAAIELQAYFGELLDQRRATPREDLLTGLAHQSPDDPEARADIVANCVLFISAGHATTTSLIAAGTLLLLESGETVPRARITDAVEEMLRTVAPVTIVVTRAAQRDEIDGCPIAAGDHRFVFLAAANRDPDVFPNADRFDATRRPNPHLSFSAGKHFCLGAPLARLHGEIAISTLLARLPNLRLDGEPEWRGSIPLRELERLQVAWGVKRAPCSPHGRCSTALSQPVADRRGTGRRTVRRRRPTSGVRRGARCGDPCVWRPGDQRTSFLLDVVMSVTCCWRARAAWPPGGAARPPRP